jgi:hypothetical protein
MDETHDDIWSRKKGRIISRRLLSRVPGVGLIILILGFNYWKNIIFNELLLFRGHWRKSWTNLKVLISLNEYGK